MRHDVHFHLAGVDQLAVTLTSIIERMDRIMATLDEVLKDVTDESTQLDSLSTLIAGLKKQVADALSGATLPPAVQAKIDAVFTQAEANKAKVAAALDANVVPPVVPPVV